MIIALLLIISNICQSCNNLNKTNDNYTMSIQQNSNLPKTLDLNIQFVFPKYIYDSKDDLFHDFFSEFYNYIKNRPGGQSYLKYYNINNVDDVYKICKTWDKKSEVGMPLVGKIFSPYFLCKAIGSDIEDQKKYDFFVGYCLNNDKFVDFLFFIKTFFYHFRLDEGYTGKLSEGKDPYGSDFFANSYASVIDTAKFFYYTKETLPTYFIDKKNIPDLYDKIPGILKKPFNKNISITYDTIQNAAFELPHDFDCYGFDFIGFYTDPEFKSEVVNYIDNDFITAYDIIDNNNIITLYAKFKSNRAYIE